MEDIQEPWSGMSDVTAYFDVTSETIRSWINKRDLPARKIGGRWKFKMSAVKRWESEAGNFVPAKHVETTDPIVLQAGAPLLLEGDCLSMCKGLPDKSIDLILTDPPYNLGLFMQDRDTNLKRMRDNYFGAAGWDDLSFDEWLASMDGFFEEASRVLKTGGSMVVFMAVIKVESLIRVAEKHGFYYKTTGTWHKKNPMPRNMNLHFVNSTESWVYFVNGARTGTFNNGGKVLHDFFETSVTPKSERSFGKHPTQKPVALMKHFVEVLSNPGDFVLDPFMGSGSTGVAAVETGRNFVGVEIDHGYNEIARKRIMGEGE